jgi:phage FluMu gp28-like protein
VNNVRYKTFMCGKLDIERDRKLQYMIDKKTTDFIWKLTLGLEFSNCIYSLQKSFLRYLKFYCYDADGINNWNQGAFPCS